MSETVPPPPPAPAPLPARPQPKVDLSGAALLWIAVIVGVCAGGGHSSHKQDFNELQAQIDRLEKKIDALSTRSAKPASAPSSAAATPAR